MRKRLFRNIFMCSCALLTISNIISIVNANSSGTISKNIESQNFEITRDQAIEDINYVLQSIKENHVSSVNKIPDEVINQANLEIKNLKNKINILEQWQIVSRILTKLHDAHTKVLSPNFLDKRLPFDIKYDTGKIICTTGEFANHEITDINNIPIQELYKIFRECFSHEIEEWAYHNFFETPVDFIPEWKLVLCGIDTSKPVKINFKTSSEVKNNYFELINFQFPSQNSTPWVSFEIDKENDLGIFKLTRCNVCDEYTNTLEIFFTEIKENHIKNVVLDLRKNSGGDSRVGNLFASYLKNADTFTEGAKDVRIGDELKHYDSRIYKISENSQDKAFYDGNLFVLTSHGTFSSAMLVATQIQDSNLGVIVGEVPGNSPTRFGNLVLTEDDNGKVTPKYFKMPNSQLTFTTTFKKFYRPDSTKNNSRLIPNVQVPAKDALCKVYEIIQKQKTTNSSQNI